MARIVQHGCCLQLVTPFLFVILCTPSEFLRKRYVDFNFSEEGFLSPSVLQTIGKAEYQSAKRGLRNDKRLCLELAQRDARKRMLRIMLHLRLGLRGNAEQHRSGQLERDYPIEFTRSELLQAELVFTSLLKQAVVVLQDSRNASRCMLVYRVRVEKLAKEIRQTPVSF